MDESVLPAGSSFSGLVDGSPITWQVDGWSAGNILFMRYMGSVPSTDGFVTHDVVDGNLRSALGVIATIPHTAQFFP